MQARKVYSDQEAVQTRAVAVQAGAVSKLAKCRHLLRNWPGGVVPLTSQAALLEMVTDCGNC